MGISRRSSTIVVVVDEDFRVVKGAGGAKGNKLDERIEEDASPETLGLVAVIFGRRNALLPFLLLSLVSLLRFPFPPTLCVAKR